MQNVNTVADLKALNKPFVFCVSGVKNSGKTTLITKLIKTFKKYGLTVATIKHDGHEFEIDHEGTDSHQHVQAGSDGTIVYSDSKFALMKRAANVDIQALLAHFKGMDVIIVEGLKQSELPKLEIVKEMPVCDVKHVLAYVTDGGFTHPDRPTFERNDTENIAKFLKELGGF